MKPHEAIKALNSPACREVYVRVIITDDAFEWFSITKKEARNVLYPRNKTCADDMRVHFEDGVLSIG